MKYLSIILLLNIGWANASFGQFGGDGPRVFVDSDLLVWPCHSKIIGEDYTIYINLPSGYDTSKINYPVLYMTDGDWNMTLARDIFSMLEQDYNTNTPIIVGIGYGDRQNMRGRDLEPKTGGPKFLSFIETEIMPFIRDKYRTSGDNALYGYSYGGVFAAYALFERPGLFNTICIGAPGNNGDEILPLASAAQKYFQTHTDLKCNVFAGVGAYEPEKVTNVKNFGAYLRANSQRILSYETVIVPDVAHGAAVGPVMQSALKFAYCRMHKPISVPEKELTKYVGNYRNAEASPLKLRSFVKNGNFYLKVGDIKILHFVPYARDKFFMYEDEKVDISFKDEGGRKFIEITALNQKLQRIEKID